MQKPSFGVLIGRFQTHELTAGHLELFRNVMGRHSRVIIFLGCTKIGPTRRNPLDFETRKAMLQVAFLDSLDKLTILPLQDKKTDEQWSREVDQRISDIVSFGDVTLYSARDGFAGSYSGKYKVKELDLELSVPKSVNATELRAAITNNIRASADFRAGVIYAIGQMFPRCVTTVDVAIAHYKFEASAQDQTKKASPPPQMMLLLGRKPGEPLWRFIGGHAEPPFRTKSFEEDVKKEALEETGLDVSNIHYVGSTAIDDWRYRQEEVDGIKTGLYLAESMTMGGRGADDIAEIKWFDINTLTDKDFEPEHRVLFNMLLKYLGRSK